MTELDQEMLKMANEIPSGQRTLHEIIPINFNLGNLEDETCEDNDSNIINDCVLKVNEMLSWRHHTATLTRDLKKYKDDELPSYARISKASFHPHLSSEAEKFFKDKIQNFNKRMRTEFRESMLTAAREYSEQVKMDTEQLWRDACTKIENGHNIMKLNDKFVELKEKWADEYRRTVNKPTSTNTAENKSNKTSEVDDLKKELDILKRKGEETEIAKLKKEMEELKESLKSHPRNRKDTRDNRRGSFRGHPRRRDYDY